MDLGFDRPATGCCARVIGTAPAGYLQAEIQIWQVQARVLQHLHMLLDL
jgi:hypothetical protein